jgi:ribosomal protein S4E
MAVLSGMGYEKDSGLGKSNKRKIDVFVPETRPRGLGLGANRKTLEKLNQLKHNLKKSGINENDDLYLEKGAFVLIQQGSYHNSYGTIDSIDEDLARLNIILAMNDTNEPISVSQYNVKLVTEKEFLKYSGYVK